MRALTWVLIEAACLVLATGCGSSATPRTVLDPPTDGVAVLQHHHSAMRNGVYVDAALSRQAAAGVHRDLAFDAKVNGPVYAQPLFLEGANGSPNLVFVATEQNQVYAFNAQTGPPAWHTVLAPPVPLSALPCGNIDPLGITGTPVIDATSRTLYLDAMTTPDGGATKRHLVYALAADDGTVRSGWPADVGALVPGFDAAVQNQRGGLLLLGGKVYVPYGGHFGDCGTYYGRVVGLDVANPGSAVSFQTRAAGGGIWAPGGPPPTSRSRGRALRAGEPGARSASRPATRPRSPTPGARIRGRVRPSSPPPGRDRMDGSGPSEPMATSASTRTTRTPGPRRSPVAVPTTRWRTCAAIRRPSSPRGASTSRATTRCTPSRPEPLVPIAPAPLRALCAPLPPRHSPAREGTRSILRAGTICSFTGPCFPRAALWASASTSSLSGWPLWPRTQL